MKKRRTVAAVIVLTLLMLVGCASQNQDATSAGSSSKDETVKEQAELRTMLSFNNIALCAKVQEAAGGGFQSLEAKRGEADTGASLSINMVKINAEDSLRISGFVYLGEDASALFDSEEDDADDANAVLKKTVKEILAEAGSKTAEGQAAGMTLTYGFTGEEKDGTTLTHLYAWAEPNGGFIYVSVEAAETGEKQTGSVKDRMLEWLLSFTVNEAPGKGVQKLVLPFGEKRLTAEDRDFLKADDAALSWESGEGWVNASYSGSTGDALFDCKLRNAAAAGEEKSEAAKIQDGQTVDAPLPWKIHTEDNILTAASEIEDDVLLFEMTVYPVEDNSGSEEEFQKKAVEWLKTVTIG